VLKRMKHLPGVVRLRLGLLDSEITDALPQFPTGAPAPRR